MDGPSRSILGVGAPTGSMPMTLGINTHTIKGGASKALLSLSTHRAVAMVAHARRVLLHEHKVVPHVVPVSVASVTV